MSVSAASNHNQPPIFIEETGEDDKVLGTFRKIPDISQFLSESYTYPPGTSTTRTFIIKLEGNPIGFARLGSIRWINKKGSITIYLKEDYRGKGYGKEALRQIMDYGFLKLGFHRLEGEVYSYNIASVKLMERFGFQLEGRLREAKLYQGHYHDILTYGILRDEYSPRYGQPSNDRT